jgi:hypothetical protein
MHRGRYGRVTSQGRDPAAVRYQGESIMRTPIQSRAVLRSSNTAGRGIAGIHAAAGVTPSCDLSVTATVQNGQACINTPFGNECLSVPSLVPNGTVASLCGDICTTFGIPTGVCVSVDIAGQQVANECFGHC